MGENEGENYGWSHAYGHSMLPCDGLHVVKINSTWMGRCDYLVLLWKESWLKLYSLRGYMIYLSSIRPSWGLYFVYVGFWACNFLPVYFCCKSIHVAQMVQQCFKIGSFLDHTLCSPIAGYWEGDKWIENVREHTREAGCYRVSEAIYLITMPVLFIQTLNARDTAWDCFWVSGI